MGLSNNKRMILFVASYVAIFTALGLFGYMLLKQEQEIHQVAQVLATKKVVTDLSYYDLPRMTVAVNNVEGGSSSRLRVDISLEVARKDMVYVTSLQPHITAKLREKLANITVDRDELAHSVPVIRADLLHAINSEVMPVPVHDLLFRELVIM